MLAHDFAQILLSLPDHEVLDDEDYEKEFRPRITNIVDTDHPDFKAISMEKLSNPEIYNIWKDNNPKKIVILI